MSYCFKKLFYLFGRSICFLLLLCFGSVGVLLAEPVLEVDHKLTSKDVSPYIEYIEDPTAKMTFANVLKSGEWQPAGQQSFSQGYSLSAYWLRLKVRNITSDQMDMVLAVQYPDLDYLDGYLTIEGYPAYKLLTGAARSFETRIFNHRDFIFPLSAQGRQEMTFYLRIQSGDVLLWPMRISTQQAFADREQAQLLFLGIIVGSMIILVLYHLFSYLLMGEIRSLLLSFFVFVLTLCVMTTKGLTSQYLWPNSPYWNSLALEFLTWLSIFLGTIYLLLFLEIGKYSSFVKGLVLGYILILSTFYFSSLMSDARWIKYGEVLMQSVAFVAFFAFAVRLGFQGRRVHSYLSLALLLLLGGGLIYMGYLQGYIAHNMLAENALPVGLLLSMAFLTFALIEQIRQERLQQEMSYQRMMSHETKLRQIQEDALRNQRQMTEDLESRVAERTGELGRALKQLAESNRLLESVSHRDGLTGLMNAGYYAEHLYKEWQRAQRDQTPLSLLLIDIDGLGEINDKYGHLTGDLCVRELARALDSEISRATDLVARNELAGFSVMLSNTPEEGAVIVAERLFLVAQSLFVVSDENKPVHFEVSIGVHCLVPAPSSKPELLQRGALRALRKAKADGGKRVVKASELVDDPSLPPISN